MDTKKIMAWNIMIHTDCQIESKYQEIFPLSKFRFNLSSNIKIIKLHGRNITNHHLFYLRDTSIQEINLSNCNRVTNLGMIHLNNIEIITLSNMNITNKGLSYISGAKEITLMFLHNISNRALGYLCNIHKIRLINCHNMSDDAIKYLGNVFEVEIISDFINPRAFAYLSQVPIVNFNIVESTSNDFHELSYLTDTNVLKLRYLFNEYKNDNLFRRLGIPKSIYFDYCDITVRDFSYLNNHYLITLNHCNEITDRALQYLTSVKILYSNEE